MQIRLTYFNFPFWRAETSRLALHLGDIPFEDNRVSGPEFMALQTEGKLPYNQLPILEVDGITYSQSVAIARFCGKLSGLYPKDDLAALRADEILDVVTQLTYMIDPSMRIKDSEKRKAMRLKLNDDDLPKWLGFLEARLGDNQFFAGDMLTVADLAIWLSISWVTNGTLDHITIDLGGFPGLKAHGDRVGGHPKISAWIAAHYSK